jgi:uncharacterized membrane protein YbhN (UPF0104 family)
MTSNKVVFTPLRIALLVAITLSNVLAIVCQIASDQPWADALGVFAVVFIMLFVFVILLELVWLHHRSKDIEDVAVKSKYRLVKWLYSILFLLGFLITFWVLK